MGGVRTQLYKWRCPRGSGTHIARVEVSPEPHDGSSGDDETMAPQMPATLAALLVLLATLAAAQAEPGRGLTTVWKNSGEEHRLTRSYTIITARPGTWVFRHMVRISLDGHTVVDGDGEALGIMLRPTVDWVRPADVRFWNREYGLAVGKLLTMPADLTEPKYVRNENATTAGVHRLDVFSVCVVNDTGKLVRTAHQMVRDDRTYFSLSSDFLERNERSRERRRHRKSVACGALLPTRIDGTDDRTSKRWCATQMGHLYAMWFRDNIERSCVSDVQYLLGLRNTPESARPRVSNYQGDAYPWWTYWAHYQEAPFPDDGPDDVSRGDGLRGLRRIALAVVMTAIPATLAIVMVAAWIVAMSRRLQPSCCDVWMPALSRCVIDDRYAPYEILANQK
uniref:Gp148 n=1 Tax=Caviid herpesvirus 2 str. CIDMTR TaxID=1415526 RepID=U6H6I2_9BETA|nr:gp148 [Caviid herpesvirus 2 str. CIDMTR]